jgi:hypothetical protein
VISFNDIGTRQLQDVIDLRPGASILVDQPHGESVLIKLKTENFIHTVLYIMVEQLSDKVIDLEKIALSDPDAKHYAVIQFKDYDPNFIEVLKALQYFSPHYEINQLKNLMEPNKYTVDLSQLDTQLVKLHHHQISPTE